MRKKIVMLLCLSFPVVLFALNENEMDWRYGIYGVRVVTNAPSRAEMAVATNALAQSIIGFVYSPSNPPPAQSSAFATNAITVIGPQSNDIASAIAHVADTNLHIAAGERQRIASALTNAAEFASATGGLWTAAAAALDGKAATNDSRIVNALQPASTNGWTVSPHEAWLTNETDAAALAALAAHAAYWPPNATASSWFTFTTNANEITITGYNIDGGTDVIIPDYINGWPVTTIGAHAFEASGVTSIGGAGNVVTVEDYAFMGCYSLASVSLPQVQTVEDFAFYSCALLASVSLPHVQTVGYSAFNSCTSLASVPLPQVQTVGDFAFYSCTLLASVPLPQVQTVGYSAFGSCFSLTSLYFDNDAPTIGDEIFAEITTPNQVTNYVTNPQATGWGDTLGGMPVVRLPLYADAVYQAGQLVATTGHVAQAIAAMPVPDSAGKVDVAGGSATNLDLYSDWQIFSNRTGSAALTNIADRPIQCTGTGAVSLAFSGLKPPTPIYLTLGGFTSVSWPTNAYAVGGWGMWQTNRLNHFSVWKVGTEIFVNALTTSEE